MSIANLWNNAKKVVNDYASKVAPAKYLAGMELGTSRDEETRNTRLHFIDKYQTALIEDQNLGLEEARSVLAREYDSGLTRYLKGEKIARSGNESSFEKGLLDALESAYSEVKDLTDNYRTSVQSRADEINASRKEQRLINQVLPEYKENFNKTYLQPEIDAFVQELAAQKKKKVIDMWGSEDNAGQLATVYDSTQYRAGVEADMYRAIATAIDVRKRSNNGSEFVVSLREEIGDIFKKYSDNDSELMDRLAKTSQVALNYESQVRRRVAELSSEKSQKKSDIYTLPESVVKAGKVAAGLIITSAGLLALLTGCEKAPVTQTPTPSTRPTVYVSHTTNNDVKVAQSAAAYKIADAVGKGVDLIRNYVGFGGNKSNTVPSNSKRPPMTRNPFEKKVANSSKKAESAKPKVTTPVPNPPRYETIVSASGHHYVLDTGKAAPTVTNHPENYVVFGDNDWYDESVDAETNIGYLKKNKSGKTGFVPYAADIHGDIVPGPNGSNNNQIVYDNKTNTYSNSGFPGFDTNTARIEKTSINKALAKYQSQKPEEELIKFSAVRGSGSNRTLKTYQKFGNGWFQIDKNGNIVR